MTIKFKTSEIVKAVATLMKVWKKSVVVPAYENFLLQMTDGKMIITINNGLVMCSVPVTVEASDFSPFQVNAWDFNKLISSFPGDEIIIKSAKGKLLVSDKKRKIAIPFEDDPVYPKINPNGNGEPLFTLEPENFHYFSKLSSFVSQNENQTQFHTGKLMFEAVNVFLESTDGMNIVRVFVGTTENDHRIRSIDPDMMDIIGSMQTNVPIEITGFDNCIVFKHGEIIYYHIETTTRYPDTKFIFNSFDDAWTTIGSADLVDAYKTVSPFSDDQDKIIDIVAKGSQIKFIGLSSGNLKAAEYTVELSENVSKSFTASFNAKFIGKIFPVFSKDVQINHSKEFNGMCLKDKNSVAVMRELIKN